MLPANSPFCEFVSDGYSVWLDVLTSGVDPLDFGAGDGDDAVRRGAGNGGGGNHAMFSRVGSCCFVLYSFVTDVLTAASSLVHVLRPGSAVLVDNYAYVGPLSSLAGVVGAALPASSVGAAFVFGLVSYTVPAVLPVGLLSASPSGLGCVSLSVSSGASVSSGLGDLSVSAGDTGSAGSAVNLSSVGGADTSSVSPECVFLVLRRGDGDNGAGDPFEVPSSPPLSYYTWSFVRSSLSRFYSSVGVSSGAGGRRGAGGLVGRGVAVNGTGVTGVTVNGASPPSSPLRFSDLSVRFPGGSSLSDWSSSEDEITSLIHSVRRAFD